MTQYGEEEGDDEDDDPTPLMYQKLIDPPYFEKILQRIRNKDLILNQWEKDQIEQINWKTKSYEDIEKQLHKLYITTFLL